MSSPHRERLAHGVAGIIVLGYAGFFGYHGLLLVAENAREAGLVVAALLLIVVGGYALGTVLHRWTRLGGADE